MAELGKGYVQIVPSAQGISGAITKVLDPEAKSAGVSAGNSIGAELGGKLKAVLVGLGIGKVVGDAISKGMNFETATAKASTLFSGTAKEFQGLQKEILGISSSTGVAANQLMEAAYSAESASVPMGNLGSMIESSSKLATAGFTDIDTALSATAKTMNAYGMMSDDVAKTQANMDAVQKVLIQTQNKGITTVGELGASLAQVTPTAAAAGVNFEQVGASLAVMTAQGTPTAQATTQLRSAIAELSKSGTKASTALSEAAQGTKYAGMSFTEMMASGADLSDVMGLLQKHADKSGVSMMDLWSSVEGGNAAMSIAKDVDTFKDDLASMATEADVVGDAYGKMSDTVAFKMQRFKNALANVGIKAFSAVATPLANVLDGVFQVMDRLSPATEKLGGAFMKLMGKFGGYIADLLGLKDGMSAVDTVVAVLEPIINGLATVFNFLADHINIVVPVLAGLTAGFVAFKTISGIMTLATTISGIITTVSGLAAAAGGLIPLIMGLISPMGIAVVVIGVLVAAGVALYKNWDTVKAKAAEIAAILAEKWDGIKQAVSNAIDAVKQTVTNVFNAIKSTVSTIWNAIKTTISTVWNAIKATITTVINGIKSTITTVWNAIKSTVTTVVNAIKTTITSVFNAIKTTTTTVWNAIKTAITTVVNAVKTTITTVFNAVKTTVTTIWNAIKTVIQTAWNAIKTAVTTAANNIKSTVTTVFNAVKSTTTSIWNAIKSAISTAWNAIKTAVSAAVNAVKTNITSGFNAAKTTATSIFNAIKSAITSAMNGARTAVSNVINGIKSTISSGLNSAKSTVTSIFNSIKSGISNAMNSAKSAVSNAISSIKSKMHFSWSLPHLKLPHISISGKFSINPPSAPHFSISWHKDAYDNPFMFGRPTVLHGFGDGHGAEMVYGHSNLMRDIREAVGDVRGGDVTQNVTINSPQALNPSEVARQTRNQTRALLLKVRTA